jgi:HJR/Mrr/RecB family endonuclease
MKEQNEINYLIESSSMILVVEHDSSNKTKIIENISNTNVFQNKVVCLDIKEIGCDFNFYNVVNKKKGVILLLDNSEKLTKKDLNVLKNLYDFDYIKSIVFFVSNLKNFNLSNEIVSRIGRNKITIKEFDDNKNNDFVWYKEISFFSNPFSIKPVSLHSKMFGAETVVKKIVKKIHDMQQIYFYSDTGFGKTTILKKIFNDLSKIYNIYYCNCSQGHESINLNKYICASNGFFNKLLGFPKKKVILLLDDIQDINRQDFEKIQKCFNDKKIDSIVYTSNSRDFLNNRELVKHIKNNIITIDQISENDAVKLVKSRLGSLKYISEENIKKIFRKNKNIRSFLQNMDTVFKHTIKNGDDIVTKSIIKKVID